MVISSLTKASPQTRYILSVSRQLTENTVFLYTLDTLPLILAVMVYIPWWPAKYIRDEKHGGLEMSEARSA